MAVTLLQRYAHSSQVSWALFLADLDPGEAYELLLRSVIAFVVRPDGGIDIETPPD